MVLAASNRAAELMREIAGAQPAAEIATAGVLPSSPPDIPLAYQHVDDLMGVPVPPRRVDEILEGFGLVRAAAGEQQSSWRIPSHRFDLQRDVDLIEEVVRVFGIANVPGHDRSRSTPESQADRNYDFEASVRAGLLGRGLNEVRTSKLISKRASAVEGAVALRNPLNEDHAALRKSFLSPLLDVLARNILAGAERVAIFELGRVFLPPEAEEQRRLGIVLWGKLTPRAHWRSEDRILDYFDLKGVIESVIGPARFERTERADLVLAVEIFANERSVGFAGQLSTEQAKAMGSTQPILFAEVNLEGHSARRATFRELDRFPAITRDIAMIVPEDLAHQQIVETILGGNEPLLVSVELFDVFSGGREQGFGAGKKSMAYALTYRDKTRTLTNEEITAVHAKIRERLQRELGVELRE
jgi:phenylalanyl-tRNA synthetase beta chain